VGRRARHHRRHAEQDLARDAVGLEREHLLGQRDRDDVDRDAGGQLDALPRRELEARRVTLARAHPAAEREQHQLARAQADVRVHLRHPAVVDPHLGRVRAPDDRARPGGDDLLVGQAQPDLGQHAP
jgi:hypothetical protein